MELGDRIKYAKRALNGIALGDCFGQSFRRELCAGLASGIWRDGTGYRSVLPVVCGILLYLDRRSAVDGGFSFGRPGYHMRHCGRNGFFFCG